MDDINDEIEEINSDNEHEQYPDDEDYDSDNDEIAYETGVITKSLDQKTTDEEDDTLFGIDTSDNYEDFLGVLKNSKRKRKSNFHKMTQYEYTKLYGILAQHIMDSNIKLPEEILDTYEVKTGVVFIISRFWIKNRNLYPLPTNLVRLLYSNVTEIVNPSSLIMEEDLDFKDENDDTERFYYNFRKGPYEKDLPIEE